MQKVTHVELLQPKPGQKRHQYFGSKAAIYEHLTQEDLGIGYDTLRTYGPFLTKPFQNSKCIIRQAFLQTKTTKRGWRK